MVAVITWDVLTLIMLGMVDVFSYKISLQNRGFCLESSGTGTYTYNTERGISSIGAEILQDNEGMRVVVFLVRNYNPVICVNFGELLFPHAKSISLNT